MQYHFDRMVDDRRRLAARISTSLRDFDEWWQKRLFHGMRWEMCEFIVMLRVEFYLFFYLRNQRDRVRVDRWLETCSFPSHMIGHSMKWCRL